VFLKVTETAGRGNLGQSNRKYND